MRLEKELQLQEIPMWIMETLQCVKYRKNKQVKQKKDFKELVK